MYVKMQFFLLSAAYDVNERISSSTRCSKHLFEKGRESEESSPKGNGREALHKSQYCDLCKAALLESKDENMLEMNRMAPLNIWIFML